MLANIAPRHPELMGRYSPLGSYRLNVSSGAVMGATGVGRWDFTIVWEEGTPA